ncbi:MAG: polyamine aminopropyltransferase [Oligoflexia bacterium]|nr:polyamine aminopropyltransferase [Oligoflexia bacterium]
MKSDLWIEEKLEDYAAFRWKVERTLFSGKSDFQSVDVVETRGHGKMLLNDGLVMLTERDEFIYHDMITHVPLFAHKNPKRVLVIGGGDGGTAREVLRHQSVEECVMVEIDKMVCDACIEHIPQTAKPMIENDPRFKLLIEDGVKYVEEAAKNGEKFDAILVDSTDPIGPAAPLFGHKFYEDIRACLNDGGVIASQGESPFYMSEMQNKLLSILSDTFKIVRLYSFTNMGYPGGLWSFTYASDSVDPVKDFDAAKVENSDLKFGYYNSEIHKSAFVQPNFVKERIAPYIKG